MFKGDARAGQKAARVARYLSSHKDRLSHSRPITIEVVKNELKLPLLDLRGDPKLRELLIQLWAEVEVFVENTDTAKFFENAYGVAFRRTFRIEQQVIAIPAPFPIPPAAPASPPPPPGEKSASA
jgi:hypothetical protein